MTNTFTETTITSTTSAVELLVETGDLKFIVKASFVEGKAIINIEYLCEESSHALLLGGEYITTDFVDTCIGRNIYELDLQEYSFRQSFNVYVQECRECGDLDTRMFDGLCACCYEDEVDSYEYKTLALIQ